MVAEILYSRKTSAVLISQCPMTHIPSMWRPMKTATESQLHPPTGLKQSRSTFPDTTENYGVSQDHSDQTIDHMLTCLAQKPRDAQSSQDYDNRTQLQAVLDMQRLRHSYSLAQHTPPAVPRAQKETFENLQLRRAHSIDNTR
jgi:hypothetical protein